MVKLEWNSDLERYQAVVDGHTITVDGDEFAENLQEMRDNLVKEQHLDKEAAEQKAWDELIDASTWTADMHGVSVDGKFECSCCLGSKQERIDRNENIVIWRNGRV